MWTGTHISGLDASQPMNLRGAVASVLQYLRKNTNFINCFYRQEKEPDAEPTGAKVKESAKSLSVRSAGSLQGPPE